MRHGYGGFGFTAVMDTAEAPQFFILETLHADGQAVDAGLPEPVKLLRLGRAGVGLQRNLNVRTKIQPRAQFRQQTIDRCRGKQAGRAAADEDTGDPASPNVRQFRFQVTDERIDVGRFLQ